MLENEQLTEQVIGAAIEVHRILGPGLLESVYERCLSRELEMRGVAHQRQVLVPVIYKGQIIDCDLRMDIALSGLVVELKSVEKILPIHEAQLLTYLKLSGNKVGLLLNFNVPKLRDGLKRMVN
jgi:GxxExxY protein